MDVNSEELRDGHQQIECLEKGLSEAIAYREKYPKEQVLCDLLICKFIQEIQKLSKKLIQEPDFGVLNGS